MDFRKRPALTAREIWTLIGIGAATLVLANTLLGVDILLARSLPGGGGFFAPWAGSRAVIWQQSLPYLSPVVQLAQQLTYGRPAPTGANPYILTIPFWLLPLYFPLALTANPAVGRGVWIFLGQLALVASAFLTIDLADWRSSRALRLAYGAFAALGLYSVLACFDGNPAMILALLYVGVLWAYATQRDELAGALLALCFFDWEAGAPFLLLCLLRASGERRWNVFAGLLMVFIVLGAVSFMISPGWIMPFLTATLASIRAPFGFTSASSLEPLFPGNGLLASRVVAGLTVIALIYEWATGRSSDDRGFIWTACFALACAPLLGFRTELSNLVVMLPAVGIVCASTTQRRKQVPWLAAVFLLISFVLPWVMFGRWLATGDQNTRNLLLLVYPFLTVLGLYWTRWWFTHPQLTWFDLARDVRPRG